MNQLAAGQRLFNEWIRLQLGNIYGSFSMRLPVCEAIGGQDEDANWILESFECERAVAGKSGGKKGRIQWVSQQWPAALSQQDTPLCNNSLLTDWLRPSGVKTSWTSPAAKLPHQLERVCQPCVTDCRHKQAKQACKSRAFRWWWGNTVVSMGLCAIVFTEHGPNRVLKWKECSWVQTLVCVSACVHACVWETVWDICTKSYRAARVLTSIFRTLLVKKKYQHR